MGIGFVPARKGGKLSGLRGSMIRTSFVDYSHEKKSIEISKVAIKKADKCLIVDDWVETGSQIRSVIKLVQNLGGEIVGIAALHAEKTPKTRMLFDKYNLKAINLQRY